MPEVAPPPAAWAGIAARLPAEGPRPAAPAVDLRPVVDLRPALRRWRRAALAAGALAAGPGPFTVFAPTHAAFAKLPAGTVESLVQPPNGVIHGIDTVTMP